MLSTDDHRRDSAGLVYVYPVVSRRAGGVSVGINLNVNNACNWACLYCQVEGLGRGGPPPIDLDRLADELDHFLNDLVHGDFMQRQVPVEARRLMDIAFSGNGEPTSAPEFAEAVQRVGAIMNRFGLVGTVPLRLITNGSLMHRPDVQAGIRQIGELGGEIWFKLDRAEDSAASEVNGIALQAARMARNLETCAGLAPTWVQTCWFALDGEVPSAAARQAYCDVLKPLAERLAGVHLYGLARPSMQPAASRLSRLPPEQLASFAQEIEQKTGVRVIVSP